MGVIRFTICTANHVAYPVVSAVRTFARRVSMALSVKRDARVRMAEFATTSPENAHVLRDGWYVP